jgi:spermidine synthase
LSALFFCSGATSLAYEVIWFKRFSHVWGNSALAMALVVSSFLVGLGIGALVFGRWADRTPRPALWYGWCEAGIGLLAILIPFEIAWLAGMNSWLYAQFHHSPLLHAITRGLLTFLVIGPPCVLMGGTLPLLVKLTAFEPDRAGQSTAWMYGVNTAGAAVGCLSAGFLLVPVFGIHLTNLMMAAANLAIALVAILAMGRSAGLGIQTAGTQVKSSSSHADSSHFAQRRSLIYAALLLTGFASLTLQMLWARQLAVMLGGSTYAFSATLFIFLIGVGFGSLLFRYLQARLVDNVWLLTVTSAILVLSAVAGKIAIPSLTILVGAVREFRGPHLVNTLVCVGAAAALELAPAIAMGVLFPLFVGMTFQKNSGVGQTVGTVYAWNTLGSIGGAFLCMLLLVPAFGMAKTFAVTLGLYLSALVLAQFRPNLKINRGLIVSLALCALSVFLAAKTHDPRTTDFGAFLYGPVSHEDLRQHVKVLSFREGAACNVLVTESAGHRWIRVNGKVDASTEVDMETQLGLAYLPRSLHPDAQDVLIIGFGSGTTAGASLLFPGTRVTCCEIEPEMVAASRFFHSVNHRPEASDRFTAVFDDGRNFLQATDRRFDLIISEPSNPWLAGISSLFTREFYDTAKSRLKPAGIFAQWVHMYALNAEDYALILRTFIHAFPHHALLWINHNNTILVGSDQPIPVTPATLERSQQRINALAPVKSDLQRHFNATSARALLLSRYLLGEEDLKRFVARQPSDQLNTDINMRLEFDAPRRLFGGPKDPVKSPAHAVLEAAAESMSLSKLFPLLGPSDDRLQALKYQTALFNRHGHNASAQKAARFGLSVASDDAFFLAQLALSEEALDDTEFAQVAAKLAQVSPDEAAKVGGGLWQRRKYLRAVMLFENLAQRHQNSAAVWMNLAMNYQALGRAAEADAARKRATQLDPLAAFMRSTLVALDAQMQKNEQKGNSPLLATPPPNEPP